MDEASGAYDERMVHIPISPSVTLQAWLFQGNGKGAAERGVVLMHPHPKLGGDARTNNVISTLSSTLASSKECSFTVLSFNSRGHGGSSGTATWRGEAEREDVLGAARWLHAKLGDSSAVTVVGYSFGAAVCGSAVGQLCKNTGGVPAWLTALVVISYPAGFLSRLLLGSHLEPTTHISLPKLFIHGGQDQFCSPRTFEWLFGQMREPKDRVFFQDADHFWVGIENELAHTVHMWLQSCFMQRRTSTR
jgi:alpha/beta superfamily hydrolase